MVLCIGQINVDVKYNDGIVMLKSKLFLPILKENPKEAEIISHRLMLRGGMIKQQSAGIYSWLPIGIKILNKISNIIREEQDRSGANEILMPVIQSADLWRESGRYDDYGKEMLRITDRHERDILFGPTNEEMVTDIFRSYVKSYKDLPLNLYHIQWKFRDEVRPRFGVMRSREFLMKDAYSFDIDAESARKAYYKMFVAYLRTFKRLGMQAIPMAADTGPIGGDLSHEFIILAATGESEIFTDKRILDLPTPPADIDYDSDLSEWIDQLTAYHAVTDEMYDESEFHKNVEQEQRLQERGIEVGHIFNFGTKYSEPMGAKVAGPDGKEVAVHMGSYGIGPSRIAAALIEACHDDNGMNWPTVAAPFEVGVICLNMKDDEAREKSRQIYDTLMAENIDVLLDDTSERPGGKFATMDLIGVPYHVIIGPKGLAKGEVEVKIRATGEKIIMAPDAAVTFVLNAVKQDLALV